MVAPVMPIGRMLDVRLLAHQLDIEPIELVRELQVDAVPLLKIGDRRWRVAEGDFAAWREKRQAAAAQEAAQERLRAQHVAGKDHAQAARKRVRFRR